LIDEASSYDSEIPSCAPPGTPNEDFSRQGFIFGSELSKTNLASLHPPGTHVLEYWHIYTARVDPMIRILHTPSFTKSLLAAKDNVQQLDKGMEALMFSIYFAAVTSSPAAEIELRLSRSKESLLRQFKDAVKIALANAGFMTSRNIMTLQALVIYMVRSIPLYFCVIMRRGVF
jgi:hypothetical protein